MFLCRGELPDVSKLLLKICFAAIFTVNWSFSKKLVENKVTKRQNFSAIQ
jgi:hypothetical protein